MKQSVWVEPRTKAGTYSVRYYDPITAKKERVKAESKEQMKLIVNQLEKMLLDYKPGSGAPYLTPLVLFERYLEALLNDSEDPRRPSTIQIKRDSLTKFLESIFQLNQLTSVRIKAWRIELMAKYSVDSVSIKLRDLRSFLRWATEARFLALNPFVGIHIPKSTFVGRRLKPDEFGGILAGIPAHLQAFFVFLHETGARLGEPLSMEWSEVDLDRGAWKIPAHKCKTNNDRIIPLSPKALQILKQRFPNGQSHVFAGLDRGMLHSAWRTGLKAAKIQGRARIHDIRHTAASEFEGRRGSLKAIFGWKSDIMADRYSHTELEFLREDLMKGKDE